MKLLMLKGLPASGKSTYARELVAQGWKRVNKDDLRAMIDDSKWSKSNEVIIRQCEFNLVNSFLEKGLNVIVDSTNFAYEDYWRGIAEQNQAEFEVKFFDTPLKDCIKRDAVRGNKSVGEKVIRGMYNQYLKKEEPKIEYDPKLPDCQLVDIDGTLAKMNGRSPFDWSKVGTDLPNEPIIKIVKQAPFTCKTIIVSGRDASCKEITEHWLHNVAEVAYDSFFMRPAGDMRKDVLIKQEIYEREIKGKYNVLWVLDDRDQVVEFWRSQGLTCLQVAEGNF